MSGRNRTAPLAALLGMAAAALITSPALGSPAESIYEAWAEGREDEVVLGVGAALASGFQAPGEGTTTPVSNTEYTDPEDPYPFASGDRTAFSPMCDDESGCPQAITDAAEEDDDLTPADVEAMIVEAFQSLPVAPSPISYQPDGDWAAVNMDFIVYTDTTAQTLGTSILGVPLTFTLQPTHWTWDFGDGSPPLPTSQPGAPYPNQTVAHTYSSASDGVTVTLTTLWSGTFTIADDPTSYPVNGFVTTTNTTGPIEIVAFDVRLVPNADGS